MPDSPTLGAPTADPGSASIWRDRDFARLWTAGTISVFGSLITRNAIPFAAILILGAGPLQLSLLRSLEMIAALVFGLIAGVWVDRVRRRPVMIWTDLGRALLLVSIPIAALAGALTFELLLVVAFVGAILSTFFDVAERAYLPTLVPPERLLAANSTLTATMSVAEFAGFGISGFLVQVLTAPFAIAIDSFSFVVSAILVRTIRRPEPPRPPAVDREPFIAEIRAGMQIVARSAVLRSYVLASGLAHLLWGIFGATWLIFASRELGLPPAAIGVIAGIGGIGSFAGAALVGPAVRRFGAGRSLVLGIAGFAAGNAFIPLAPSGAPFLAALFLIGQQLLGDACATGFEVLGGSVLQASVDDAALGRVMATSRTVVVLLMLVGTVAGGVIGDFIGLREALWFGIGAAVLAMVLVARSPLGRLTDIPVRAAAPETVDELPVTE